MRFLERKHYCESCEKSVYFLNITTLKFLEKDHVCPVCSNTVSSYWNKLANSYVLPLIFGTCFFANSVIYSFWIVNRGNNYTIDLVNIIVNLVIASTLAIVGLQNRKKDIRLTKKIGISNQIMLKSFRKQSLLIFSFIIIGIIFSFSLNYVLYLIFS